MSVRVELYGIPRSRAGVETVAIERDQQRIELGDILSELARRYPGLAECIDGDALRPGFVASVNGQRFVTARDEVLPDGSSLLIMSADAGG